MSVLHFATCERGRALLFLKKVYPSRDVKDAPESAGPLLDLIEQDILRLQDPDVHGNRIELLPGKNFREELCDIATRIARIFHEG
jgi:hypothetical protein